MLFSSSLHFLPLSLPFDPQRDTTKPHDATKEVLQYDDGCCKLYVLALHTSYNSQQWELRAREQLSEWIIVVNEMGLSKPHFRCTVLSLFQYHPSRCRTQARLHVVHLITNEARQRSDIYVHTYVYLFEDEPETEDTL